MLYRCLIRYHFPILFRCPNPNLIRFRIRSLNLCLNLIRNPSHFLIRVPIQILSLYPNRYPCPFQIRSLFQFRNHCHFLCRTPIQTRCPSHYLNHVRCQNLNHCPIPSQILIHYRIPIPCHSHSRNQSLNPNHYHCRNHFLIHFPIRCPCPNFHCLIPSHSADSSSKSTCR
jgi:hypothetical protein